MCSISPLRVVYRVIWTALGERGLVSGMNTITWHVIIMCNMPVSTPPPQSIMSNERTQVALYDWYCGGCAVQQSCGGAGGGPGTVTPGTWWTNQLLHKFRCLRQGKSHAA